MKSPRGFFTLPIVLSLLALLALVSVVGIYEYKRYSNPCAKTSCDHIYPQPSATTTPVADLVITYPTKGTVLTQDQQVMVRWKTSDTLLKSIPAGYNAYVFIYMRRVNDGQGVPNSGSVGDGNPAAEAGATWDISRARYDATGTHFVPYDPGTYVMSAHFQIEPKDQSRECAKTVNHDCQPDDETAALLKKFANIDAAEVTFTIVPAATQSKPASAPADSRIIHIVINGFSFTLPDGWRVFDPDVNTTGFGYILMNARGGTIAIQCPPVESNFEGFANLAGSNLAFTQQRTFVQNGKTYTISYAEYNPATANIVGAYIHVSGGTTKAEECKLGGTADRSGVVLDEVWTSWQQEIVNGMKEIYTTWQ